MFKELWEKVNGSKTYIVMAALIIYAVVVVGWQQGNWTQAWELVLGALGASSMRHAINK